MFDNKQVEKKYILPHSVISSPQNNIERKRKISYLNKSICDQSPLNIKKKFKNNKMEKHAIVQESAFDSFEFDEKFLMKLDVQIGEYQVSNKKNIAAFEAKNQMSPINERKIEHNFKISDSFRNYGNQSKIIEETNLLKSSKIVSDFKDNNNDCANEISSLCQSPVFKLWPPKGEILSSSTPLSKEIKANKRNEVVDEEDVLKKKNTNDYVDFDLFEDWDDDFVPIKNSQENKSLITLSQALEMAEEAEKAMKPDCVSNVNDEMYNSSDSIDLLTGKVITAKTEVSDKPCAQSVCSTKRDFSGPTNSDEIHLQKALPTDLEKQNFFDASSIIMDFGDDFDIFCNNIINKSAKEKSKIAQKLNFDGIGIDECGSKKQTETKNKNSVLKELDLESSFDAVLQSSFFDKLQDNEGNNPILNNCKLKTDVVNICDKNTSSDNNYSYEFTNDSLLACKKRGKFFRVEESDDDEVCRQSMLSKRPSRKSKKGNTSGFVKRLLDLEAEVSDESASSKDESLNEEDEYEASFVDDESHSSDNNDHSFMTAKYLQSVKMANNIPHTFKIPKPKPYIIEEVFSQMPQENNSDYEINSFCVNNIESENSELSDLEIAEKILEMERKKKKQALKKRRLLKRS